MMHNPLPYRFIVLDGVEGCGKSTQAQLLAQRLQQRGEQVIVTHEPGGTLVGEAIRAVLLDPELEMGAITEAFLFCASRAQHLQEVIEPALGAGKIVVCDRFSAATAAYQGYASGLGLELLRQLDEIATSGRRPDMTIILDLDPAVGRARKRGMPAPPDRIERKRDDYHRRVRRGFLEYARQLGPQGTMVDGAGSCQQVHRAILEVLGIESDTGRSAN